MVTLGLLVRLEAKPGKEADGPASFGIFDVFPDDAGWQAHLAGRVAAALPAR
jgi:hypothetical protein